ncbi:hypothetical protein [Phaeodactylibacter luteus]|uniref:Uncharacterized protein n=1 Tax=Phaeodactylibacter luteus TaxID=1564516 RepID=A0A5C6RIB2_9BACT|nr:hypothetical protein [Phaeodactylibacter luteus]TXB62168.1 hypothetical protein FRY97_15405 [Phaeodactylibacter luteus]
MRKRQALKALPKNAPSHTAKSNFQDIPPVEGYREKSNLEPVFSFKFFPMIILSILLLILVVFNFDLVKEAF